MKNLFSRCSVAAIILLTACSREVPQKLQNDFSGNWIFKKVTEGTLIPLNAINYENAALTLNADHTAFYTDPAGVAMRGTWQVEYRTATFIKTYSNKSVYHLNIGVQNENGTVQKHFDSERVSVQRVLGDRQLYIREREDGKAVRYKLKRA